MNTSQHSGILYPPARSSYEWPTQFTPANTVPPLSPQPKSKLRPATPTARPKSAAAYTYIPASTGPPTPRCFDAWKCDPFLYRINELPNESSSSILQEVCERRGWKRYGPEHEELLNGPSMNWNLWWRFSQSPINTTKSIYSWQYTNHMVKFGFCTKDYLANFIKKMQDKHGAIYDFIPTTFILPRDYELLLGEHERRAKLEFSNHENPAEQAQNLVPIDKKEEAKNTKGSNSRKFKPVWILKPAGKCQGKGIMVLNQVEDLCFMMTDSNNNYSMITVMAVQEYIARPLLIGGFKFDLRIYVCIPCISPLTVYIYREGLARFATEKYDLTDLSNCFSHLTNASLNKTGPNYEEDKETVGKGCKWSLGQLRAYLKEIGGENDWYLWQRIVSIVNLTLIGETNRWIYAANTRNCFAFLGFDILIDERLRPWLLEVNLCPGINADCEVDYVVKGPMLNDLFNLIGLPNSKASKSRPGKPAPRIYDPLYSLPSNYPPKYMPTPLSHIKPSTVNKALELIQPKNRDKFEANETLKRRLADMTAIYSEKLIPSSMQKKPSGKKTASKSSLRAEKKPTNELPPNELRHAFWNWKDSVSQCGDWVRIFPFDRISNESCNPRYCTLDTNMLAQHIETQLTNARLLHHQYKNEADDELLSDALKKCNKLTTEVWVPRCNQSSAPPKSRPKSAASRVKGTGSGSTSSAGDSVHLHPNVELESNEEPTAIMTIDSCISCESTRISIHQELEIPPEMEAEEELVLEFQTYQVGLTSDAGGTNLVLNLSLPSILISSPSDSEESRAELPITPIEFGTDMEPEVQEEFLEFPSSMVTSTVTVTYEQNLQNQPQEIVDALLADTEAASNPNDSSTLPGNDANHTDFQVILDANNEAVVELPSTWSTSSQPFQISMDLPEETKEKDPQNVDAIYTKEISDEESSSNSSDMDEDNNAILGNLASEVVPLPPALLDEEPFTPINSLHYSTVPDSVNLDNPAVTYPSGASGSFIDPTIIANEPEEVNENDCKDEDKCEEEQSLFSSIISMVYSTVVTEEKPTPQNDDLPQDGNKPAQTTEQEAPPELACTKCGESATDADSTLSELAMNLVSSTLTSFLSSTNLNESDTTLIPLEDEHGQHRRTTLEYPDPDTSCLGTPESNAFTTLQMVNLNANVLNKVSNTVAIAETPWTDDLETIDEVDEDEDKEQIDSPESTPSDSTPPAPSMMFSSITSNLVKMNLPVPDLSPYPRTPPRSRSPSPTPSTRTGDLTRSSAADTNNNAKPMPESQATLLSNILSAMESSTDTTEDETSLESSLAETETESVSVSLDLAETDNTDSGQISSASELDSLSYSKASENSESD